MTERPICLAAGGTGGHIFPALAVAQELQKRGYKTYLFTDYRGATLLNFLPDLPAKLHVIAAASPLKGNIWQFVTAITKLMIGAVSALFYLLVKRPAVIIGFGGYPSLAPLLVGRLLCVPFMIHEQNAFLGRANHLLARFTRMLALSWPETRNLPANVICKHTGLPVRQAFFTAAENNPLYNNTSQIHLVILGGSQGAEILATLVPESIAMLNHNLKQRLHIHQQARPEQINSLSQRYASLAVKAEIKTFFDNVPKLLSKSHLVICRAGASSVAELAAIGRPALLLPLPSATDDHQRINAMQMECAGGALCLDEKQERAAALAARLMQLLGAPKVQSKMARNAKTLASPDAAHLIVNLAESLFGVANHKETGSPE